MLCFAYLWGNSVFVSGDGTAQVKWLWPREPEVWGVDESDLWLVHPARSPHTRQQVWDPREHVPAKLFLRILHFDTRDHVKTVGGKIGKNYVQWRPVQMRAFHSNESCLSFAPIHSLLLLFFGGRKEASRKKLSFEWKILIWIGHIILFVEAILYCKAFFLVKSTRRCQIQYDVVAKIS